MPPNFAPRSDTNIPLYVVASDALDQTLEQLEPAARAWVIASGFTAKLAETCVIPKTDGSIQTVLAGWGDAKSRRQGRFHMASIASKLPAGDYKIESGLTQFERHEAALAWLLGNYRFDRYTKKPAAKAHLVEPFGVKNARILAEAEGSFLTRDLINTPTNDMGPEQLETAFFDLATKFKAKVTSIIGDDLLKENLPLVHAVGRASDQKPRLLDMVWGDETHPKITLVGKGVCFDTGGLNIKPGASMGLMKKDMGGAANVMGLAYMIMALGLNVRLRVLVPAVENSISAGAFRPQDVLTSRKGLSVEINNTDAEGRLVLADALAMADEESPDLLVCMATLTGAARVALGPDVPPFFTDDNALADKISAASKAAADPLWRLPFWDPYEGMIEPDMADLDNAPAGGMAGAITAALFLRRFVENTAQFVHLDMYGWTPVAKPGRPKGGEAQSIRAMLQVIEGMID